MHPWASTKSLKSLFLLCHRVLQIWGEFMGGSQFSVWKSFLPERGKEGKWKREKKREGKKYKTENKIAPLSQIKADLLTACVWFYSRSFCTRASPHALAMLGCCNPEKTPSNKFSVRQSLPRITPLALSPWTDESFWSHDSLLSVPGRLEPC